MLIGPLQMQGDRPHQEDRFLELRPGSLSSNKDIAIFAVFDGQYALLSRCNLKLILIVLAAQVRLYLII